MDNAFLLESDVLKERDREFFQQISPDMDNTHAALAIYHLSKYLSLYYGKKVIILLPAELQNRRHLEPFICQRLS